MIGSMGGNTYTAPMAESRVRNIPEMLWRRFKAICLLKGARVNDTMIELIKRYVDEQEEKG